MTRTTEPYLAALKATLGNALLPAVPTGMPQQLAMCAQRMLASLYCDVHFAPKLQTEARHQYRSLLPTLRETLGESPLISGLEATLSDDAEFSALQSELQQVIKALHESDDARSPALIAKLVNIDGQVNSDYLSALEGELLSETDGATGRVFSKERHARLQEYLRSIFPTAPALEIADVNAIPGGFSKQTIFVDLRNKGALPDTVVVRLDKADSPVGTTVVDEFEIIQTLHSNGVAVPQPFAMETSGDVLGGPFLVVGKAAGSNAGDALDVTAGSKALSIHLAETMAAMHLVPEDEFGNDVAGRDVPTHERLLGEIEGFENQWRAMKQPSVALESAFAWLKANLHLADGARSLVHKDIGCHNFVAENDAVSAILDWETAVIGNPAQDLGYARKTVVQMSDWQTFIDAYAATGAPLPPAEQIDYYEVWGFTWLNVMLGSARFAFETGATDDLQLGYAGMHLAARLHAQLNEHLLALAYRS